MFGFMINVSFRRLLSRKKWVLWRYLQRIILKNHKLKLGNVYWTSVIVPFHAIMRWLENELQGHSGWEEEERTPHYDIRQGFASSVEHASRRLCSKPRGGQHCLPEALKLVSLLCFSRRMAISGVCRVFTSGFATAWGDLDKKTEQVNQFNWLYALLC